MGGGWMDGWMDGVRAQRDARRRGETVCECCCLRNGLLFFAELLQDGEELEETLGKESKAF